MRFRAAFTALVLCSAVLLAADDRPALRALDVPGVKFKHVGNSPKPTEITSADELTKAAVFADDAGRTAVAKQVDFAKDKLVVFAWSGSGGDKLKGDLVTDGKKTFANFTYSAGVTDDLRRHGFVFVVPKDAEVKVTPPK